MARPSRSDRICACYVTKQVIAVRLGFGLLSRGQAGVSMGWLAIVNRDLRGLSRTFVARFGMPTGLPGGGNAVGRNDHASLPIAWRLDLPEDWGSDPVRRKKAGVPGEVRVPYQDAGDGFAAHRMAHGDLARGNRHCARLALRRLRIPHYREESVSPLWTTPRPAPTSY